MLAVLVGGSLLLAVLPKANPTASPAPPPQESSSIIDSSLQALEKIDSVLDDMLEKIAAQSQELKELKSKK
jgi:hypothetical protein